MKSKLFSVRLFAAVTVLLLALPHLSANASIMDFEGVANPGEQKAVGNSYIEEGYELYNPGDPTDAAIIGQPSQNTSGSDYYTWNSPDNNNPIVLTAVDSSVFNFDSLDVGGKRDGVATFDITGYYAGGGTVVYNVIDQFEFTAVNLGWNSLSKVEFKYVSGDFGAIDNLSLASSVPEPTSMLTFVGLGVFTLVGRRRRRKA